MDHFIPMEKRTVYTIIKTKYLDHVEKEGMYPTIKLFLVIFWSFIVGLIWAFPDTVGEMVGIIVQMGNFIIPKTIMVLFVFMGLPVVFEQVRDMERENGKKHDMAKIWGVPVVELVGYLFEKGDFSRSEVIETFAISRVDYGEIAWLLDKNNILIRGENNSRKLNPEMTRQMIADILMGRDEQKYGEIIGDRMNFFDILKDKIGSLLSREKDDRWKKRKLDANPCE